MRQFLNTLNCYFVLIFMQFYFVDSLADCSNNLVSGPHGVPDDHLSATTQYNGYSPQLARLHTNRCWTSNPNGFDQYIQVDFDSSKLILAIQTKGRYNYNQWVSTFVVVYRLKKNPQWITIQDDNGNEKVFPGNSDRNTVVTNRFPKPIIADQLRIHARSWRDRISLRFELIGCTADVSRQHWQLHPIAISDMQSSLWNKTASDLGTCTRYCYSEAVCKSFVYNEDVKTCSAFDQEFFHGFKMEGFRGSRYFRGATSLLIDIQSMTDRGYTHDQNLIYKVYTTLSNFSVAKEVCVRDTSDLFMVRNRMMMDVLKHVVWTRLNIESDLSVFVGGSRINGKWMFNNDKEIPHDLWKNQHPKDDDSLCVFLSTKGLATKGCWVKKRHFICGF